MNALFRGKTFLLSLSLSLTCSSMLNAWAQSGDASPPAADAKTPPEAHSKADEEAPAAKKKVKKERMSDMQKRYADEGYYATIKKPAGSEKKEHLSDMQKKHSGDGYYSNIPAFVPPPVVTKPVEPPPPPINPHKPALNVPTVGTIQGGKKYEDDPGATGSILATRHAKQARDLLGSGHYDLAKGHFRESLNAVPNQPDLFPGYWESCAKTKDWHEAQKALDKFFALDPSKKKEYLWAYGQAAYELRQYDKARATLHEAANYGHHLDDVHETLLKIAQLQKNNPEVINQFNALVKLRPQDYKTRLDYANTLELAGNHSGALTHYKQAVNLQPSDGATAARVAYMLIYHNKDYRGAIGYYQKAIAADPTNAPKYQDGIKYAQAQMAQPKARVQQ